MGAQSSTVELVIAEIASAQHGVVARSQLLNAGVSRREIARRLTNGLLMRVYPGVYRVGHWAPSVDADYMAATLGCGDGALLADRAAAYLWRLVRGRPPRPVVIAPTQRRIEGIETRRCRNRDPRDAAELRGIPLTTVARTIVDLAASLTEEELARACHEAGANHETTPRQVEEVLSRRPTSPGTAKLRRVIHGEVRLTLSELERRFLVLLEKEGLPLPETNRPAGGRRADCRWPAHRLTVELDSYRYHRSRHAWELDRRREREAYARGDDFRRYTRDDVFEHPRLMLRELRGILLGVPLQGR